MEEKIELTDYKEIKRSKRHRRKRNNISDKDRYYSVLEFATYAREVESKRMAKYPKTANPNPFLFTK